MQFLGRNPIQEVMTWRSEVAKEVDYLCSRANGIPVPPSAQHTQEQFAFPRGPAASYRLPCPGERVMLGGFRRSPLLNGAAGEILSGADQDGYVTVRLLNAQPGQEFKQVQLKRVIPLTESRSESSLRYRYADEAEPSVVSGGSSRGTCASVASRSSGSSLKRSARSRPRMRDIPDVVPQEGVRWTYLGTGWGRVADSDYRGRYDQ